MENPIQPVTFFGSLGSGEGGGLPVIMDIELLYQLVLKLMFLSGFFLYILFSILVVRQVALMDSTIKTPLSPILRIVAWANVLVSVGVFLLALAIL